jgi:hypothetical protein
MTDSVVTAIPLIARLGAIVQWLLVLNAVLVGVIILLIFRQNAMREELRQLREKSQDAPPDQELPE